MKKIILTILLLSFFLVGFAQLDNYDLSKYKLGDYDYSFLQISLDARGNSSFGVDHYLGNKDELSSYDFRPQLSLDHYRQMNSRKVQNTQSGVLALAGNFRKDETEEDGTREITVNNYYDWNRKVYNAKGSQFFSFGGYYRAYYRNAKGFSDFSNTEYTISNTTLVVRPQVSYGFGRIEDVTPSWQAIRILDKLQENGSLTSNPTEEQIVAFGDLIIHRQFFRMFDFRLKRIADIDALDQFLKGKGLVTDSDALYFTTLYDLWSYGVNGRRQTGSVFEIGLKPYLGRDWFNSDFWGPGEGESDMDYGLGAFLRYEKAKPLSMKTQFNFAVALEGGYLNDFDEYIHSSNESGTYVRPNAEIEIGVFPTTRTEFTSNLSAYYLRTDLEDQNYPNGLRVNWSINWYYYISPQTRLSLNANWFLKNTENDNTSSASGSLYCNSFFGTEQLVPVHYGLEDCSQFGYSLRLTHSFF